MERKKGHSPEMVRRAQRLRRVMTCSERLLWQLLRDRKLAGVKFRRQQVIGRFIADFFAPSHALIVEIDGGIHDAQKARDAWRDAWMQAEGLRVLRIPASLVEDDPQGPRG